MRSWERIFAPRESRRPTGKRSTCHHINTATLEESKQQEDDGNYACVCAWKSGMLG